MIRSEPKLRFKGFVKSWRMERLDDVVTFSKGKGYSKKDIKSNGDPLLLYGSLYTDYKTLISTVETFSDLKSGSVVSKGNEVVVPSSGETRLDIARASAIVAPGIIIGGDLNVLQPESFISPVYLALNLNSKKSKKELVKKAQGSSVVHLYNEDLKSVTIDFPSIEEQKKIGEFFKLLDGRITNQKRKIEKIKALKQAYLTEMFPQEDEDVPRKRFNDFDSMWQVDELQNLVTFSKGRGYSKKDIQSEGTPLLLYGTLYTNYETMITSLKTFTNLKENSVLSLGGEVVIPSSGETSEDIARASTILDQGIIIGGDLNVLRPKNFICASYLALNLSNSPTKNQLARKAQGSSVVHLYNEDLKNIKVCYPTIEEQQKIGEFFKTLDEKIEAEEKKLEKLKKMKEAFLEEMFV